MTVIIINIWVGVPYTLLQLTGVLQNIPEELYEAAKVDGANAFQTFTKITLPYMLYVTTPYLIVTFTGNVNNFNVIYLLSGGDPITDLSSTAGKTDLLVTWLYKLTIDKQYYNIGAVIGIMTFVILYMTCQGTLFFLSGEEFARTKDGQDNTFKTPISLNRLDWEKAWENKELVHYYQGLIALRKQLSGLCDKSKDSYKRITDMWKEKDVVGFTVLNDEKARWSQVKIIYNARKNSYYKEELLDDGWEILSDADDSWCWEKGICAGRQIEAAPQSVLILGHK